jgi:NADP-dependent 3-hydroxy acid dehydrogenase YdfG
MNKSLVIITGASSGIGAAIAKAALWMYQQPQTICVRDLVFAPTYYEP